ncbi:MAG: 50S ribosomal protein L18 [Verrucomicrobiales bacterium]|nr:50S ribosomal protein L18 [Verrucomicrobiales bacterium]MCP5528662.1 50S ribosomal protein L18 [Verrucomicrobiales bacterium]
MRIEKKQELSQRRRRRIRRKVHGSAERPRLSVRFTGQHIYVQFIDDVAGITLASASTRSKTLDDRAALAANVKSAGRLGKFAGELARERGITQVVFDRSGARYHGKVKALADAVREAGIKF